jgi:hypothetical protein
MTNEQAAVLLYAIMEERETLIKKANEAPFKETRTRNMIVSKLRADQVALTIAINALGGLNERDREEVHNQN